MAMGLNAPRLKLPSGATSVSKDCIAWHDTSSSCRSSRTIGEVWRTGARRAKGHACVPWGLVRTVVVAAGVVVERARVLLSRRPVGTHLAGAWEFPGGKV